MNRVRIVRPGDVLLTGDGSWSAIGTDDLTTRAGVRRQYVAPAGTAAGLRIAINMAHDAGPGTGIEAIVDRGWNGGSDEFGIVFGWRTTSRTAHVITADSDSSDSADTLVSQIIDGESEDLTLGTAWHVRATVVGDQLRVTKVESGVETIVFQTTLHPFTRKIALRGECVGGEVLVWWNPDGIMEFKDAPISQIAIASSVAVRSGLWAGRHGRFEEVQVEYRIDQLAGSAALQDVQQTAANLSAARVTIGFEASAPAMSVDLQVHHVSETDLPERFERWSRVHLRSARVMVRPGHSFQAVAMVRTVDEDVLQKRSPTWTAAGTVSEVFTLRDDAGRVLVPEGETTPPGEVASPLVYQLLAPPASYPLECSPDFSSETSLSDDNRPEALQSSRSGPRVWKFPIEAATHAERQYVLDMFASQNGQTKPFLWRHPRTGELALVVLGTSDSSFRLGDGSLGSGELTIRECEVPETSARSTAGLSDSTDSNPGSFGGPCEVLELDGLTLGNPSVARLTLVRRFYSGTTLLRAETATISMSMVSWDRTTVVFAYANADGRVLASASISSAGVMLSIAEEAYPGIRGADEIAVPGTGIEVETGRPDPRLIVRSGCGTATASPCVSPYAQWTEARFIVISCAGTIACQTSMTVDRVLCSAGDIERHGDSG